MKRSSPLMAFATGCALTCAVVLTAQPAHADTDAPLAVCPGQAEQTIHPGLTLLPRFNTVSVHGRFGPCVNQVIDDDHVFADYSASASGLISCSVNAPDHQRVRHGQLGGRGGPGPGSARHRGRSARRTPARPKLR